MRRFGDPSAPRAGGGVVARVVAAVVLVGAVVLAAAILPGELAGSAGRSEQLAVSIVLGVFVVVVAVAIVWWLWWSHRLVRVTRTVAVENPDTLVVAALAPRHPERGLVTAWPEVRLSETVPSTVVVVFGPAGVTIASGSSGNTITSLAWSELSKVAVAEYVGGGAAYTVIALVSATGELGLPLFPLRARGPFATLSLRKRLHEVARAADELRLASRG